MKNKTIACNETKHSDLDKNIKLCIGINTSASTSSISCCVSWLEGSANRSLNSSSKTTDTGVMICADMKHNIICYIYVNIGTQCATIDVCKAMAK